ncbi:hypothetical protein [Streptomyces cinereospinus]|uniref:Uncharacterized protein n=1 Tax=Streptomyces cinereospinus TaxID=285561 RepID=A0ABV5MWR4_9ACTN
MRVVCAVAVLVAVNLATDRLLRDPRAYVLSRAGATAAAAAAFGGGSAGAAAGVAATALAGALMCEPRRRSDGLLPPVAPRRAVDGSGRAPARGGRPGKWRPDA